jgi:uncharacterized lipoprotein YmbA
MKWLTLAALMMLAACGSGPAIRTYVLSSPAAPIPRAVNEVGRPVLDIPRVSVPEYLDSTDMLVRDGQNEMKVSQTGRWGERLSIGVRDALAADLGRRLPRFMVVRTPEAGQSIRLLVNVEAFEARSDGTCVLTARWSVAGGDGRTIVGDRRNTFITQVVRTADGITDAAVAAAMAGALDQLSDAISVVIPTGR